MIAMYMKVQGYRQSIFIDKYFFILTIIMNGFFWFLTPLSVAFLFVATNANLFISITLSNYCLLQGSEKMAPGMAADFAG